MANCRAFWLVCITACTAVYAADRHTSIDSAILSGRYFEAETLLRKQISAKPNQWDSHFRLAKVLSWQKKFVEAEFEYRALLGREPANADYLLGLAQVFLWRGDPKAALPLLEQGKLLAPGNPDILRLQIQTLAAINDAKSRQQALLIQQQASQRFPELNWAIVSPVDPETRFKSLSQPVISNELDRKFNVDHANQIELGGSYDHLSNNRGYWRSEYLAYEHRFAPRQLMYAMFTQTERFRFNDEQFLLGGYYPLSSKLTLNLEGNVSPSPKVLAKNSIMASLQGTLGGGWFLTGGYRHSEYGTGPLNQGFATLETYFGDFRAAYTARLTDSLSRTQFGHRFDFSYYYQGSSFITFTYSMGGETGGFQGVIYDTQLFGLHGRHWFNNDWALTWDLGHIRQGDAYNRNGVSLGIRRAF